MSNEEFCERFVAHMLDRAQRETFNDGRPIREYAEKVAPTFIDVSLTPEKCAEVDMYFWGE